MSAIGHFFGADLTLDHGRLELVSDVEQVRQGLLRRLLTIPGQYIWQPDYGAGLAAMVGQVVDTRTMEAVIQAQVMVDAGVDASQGVTVTVTAQDGGGCVCRVSYVDAASGQQQDFGFSS
ncbi:tail protein [Gluconobacter morbifer]|uniref:Putative phage tail protein n=1 Tax=Gluconobacter morbifer G707 TaxID=1088869 RepID=G6XMB9_9PROT|nr:tail protein [Gluconobacter morbifer]EHH67017.1 putative phage tail protein [Gluconobacter morbifer G707]